ncbi:MAG: AzlC family ABC transporter permease [Clostridiales bacterium]|nr:AzlC family ABC transporter permease [Clostridiales bacterium]
MKTDQSLFKTGMRDGMPVCLGYIAVGFAIGIAARNAGLNAVQGLLLSLFNNASAGEYAGIRVIAAAGSYFQMALMTLVANIRYLLMSCSLSQKFSSETPFFHRLVIGYDITDELFGLAINRPGKLVPKYMYGAFAVAIPGWALGTMFGVIVGNVLPAILVGALSVMLYGMFIAIIIPPAKKDRAVLVCVIVSFAASFAVAHLPLISNLSEGTRIIILTVAISALAAVICPVKNAGEGEEDSKENLKLKTDQ